MKKIILLLLVGLILPQSSSIALKKLDGDGYLQLTNLHLKESISVQYRKQDGDYSSEAMEAINHALRCRQTGEEHTMHPRLVELVDQIQDHFGGKEIQVVSGYRSPKFNESLRQSGHKVAPNSRHIYGYAMDIRIPGVSTETLKDYARSLQIGGVGYYPQNGFVHVDIDRVRYW